MEVLEFYFDKSYLILLRIVKISLSLVYTSSFSSRIVNLFFSTLSSIFLSFSSKNATFLNKLDSAPTFSYYSIFF